MDHQKLRESISAAWATDVLPSLSGLVEIPAVSTGYDAAWEEHGHLRAAVEHVRGWVASRGLPDARCDVVQLDGRAPLLLVDVPATPGAAATGTVLLYGHLDKQPPLGDWSEGLGPWQAVIRDDRLYGRGSADDGYSGYAATTALEAVQGAGGEHARAVLLLETGEESGSPDLPAYLEHLDGRLGEVSLVVCLDGGGGDYERLWLTSSLRGAVQATVTVRVLETGRPLRARERRRAELVPGHAPAARSAGGPGDRRGQGGRDGGAHPGGAAAPEAAELVALHAEVAVPRFPCSRDAGESPTRRRTRPQQHLAADPVRDRRRRAPRTPRWRAPCCAPGPPSG